MTTKNLEFVGVRISIVLIGVFLAGLFPVLGSASNFAGVKIVDPVHGPAKIKGEDISYYYYKARITANAETSLIFKQDTCMVSDRKDKKYSKYWIHIAGASAGLSFTKQAPINMKTLAIELEGGQSSNIVEWNTSMVDGPEGALEFTIPKGGYVILNFLWEVPKGFSPSRIKIGDLIDVYFKK